MNLTLDKIFSEVNIVKASIDRVQQTAKDKIIWKQYGKPQETKSRVFKTYLGDVTGVMAGSVIGKNSQKPLRERRALGYGYAEIAYLGDRYQMDIERLSDLQDLVDKFNEATPLSQQAVVNDIIGFLYDDYRQVLLNGHKRIDLLVGELLMNGKASVKNADNREGKDVLNIELPFHFLKPSADVKSKFITYLQQEIEKLKSKYGVFNKMIMSRGTFVKNIIGSSEFGEKFKMNLTGNEMFLSTGLVSSDLASQIFTGIGLPAIEIKDDYVVNQNGENVQVFADGKITLLQSDDILRMRHHKPYELTDPIPGRQYVEAECQMAVCNYRDENGRYMEYTAEWIPEFIAPNKIVNIDLSTMNG